MKYIESEVVLQGNPISDGIVMGTPFLFVEKEHFFSDVTLKEKDILHEIKRYRQALKKSQLDLELEIQTLIEEGADVAADILDSHLEILKDPLLTEIVEQKIYGLQKNTESAINDLIDEYTAHFEQIKDKDFQGRIKDMVDVAKRILYHLLKRKNISAFSSIPQNAIVITQELIPSASTCRHISGLVTEKGGPTSHTAIIARSKSLPFVSNISLSHFSSTPKTIIIDGYTGKVILNPSSETCQHYQNLLQAKEKSFIDPNAILQTVDGYPITISGSISSVEELDLWKKSSSSPISLVRTELIFLAQERKMPDGEMQFQTYKSMLEKGNCPITFRLFDLAQDKTFIDLTPSSDHSFWMKDEKIFHEHIQALLKASSYGKLQILLPFISDIDEFLEIKTRILKIKKELHLTAKIPIGTMVELPSAAICVDQLAKEADFLSIGTNDLTQYLLAKDRSQAGTTMMLHPSLIRIVSRIVRAAKKENKPLSICGELGGNPLFVPILMGLGVFNFSLCPAKMGNVAKVIQKTSFEKSKQLAQQASLISSQIELQKFIESFLET